MSELRWLTCSNLACSQSTINTLVAAAPGAGMRPSAAMLSDGVSVLISHSSATNVGLLVCNSTAHTCATVSTNVLPPQFGNAGWTSVDVKDGVGAVAFAASNATHSVVGLAQCVDVQCTAVSVTKLLYTVAGANRLNWGSDRALAHPYVAFYAEGFGLVLLHCLDKACSPAIVLSSVIDSATYVSDVGLYASLVVSNTSRLLVAYHDASELALRIVVCTNEACDARVSRTYPSTYGWDPTIALDPVSGLPVVAFGDPADNETAVLWCGDATCDPLHASLTSLGPGRHEAHSMVVTRFYRPLVVTHATLDFTMQALLVAADAACLPGVKYPCAGRVQVSITSPGTAVLVTNLAAVSVAGLVVSTDVGLEVATLSVVVVGAAGIAPAVTLFANGTFVSQQPVPLAPGANALAIHVLAPNGTVVGTAAVTIISDREPPLLAITSHTNGTVVFTDTVQLAGTSADALTSVVSISVDGTLSSATTSPTWSVVVTLAAGATMVFNVTATDQAGNVAWQTLTLVQGGLNARLLCPPDLTLECGLGLPLLVGARLVNCQGTVDATEQVTPACGATGTHVRTFTASGCPDPAPQCIQRILVVDTTAPLLTCPPATVLSCRDFATTTLPQAVVETQALQCGATPSLALDSGAALSCGGTTTRLFTARDDCGLTATCVHTVTVAAEHVVTTSGAISFTPTTTPAAASGGLTADELTALIVGVLILLLILLCTLLAYFWWRRKQRRKAASADHDAFAMAEDDDPDVHSSQLYVENPNSSSHDMRDVYGDFARERGE